MKISTSPVAATGVKFVIEQDGRIAGRAYLYVMSNDLHPEPFGFLEDVFVEPEFRGRAFATSLIHQVIDEAKRRGCYKLVACSRHERVAVHRLYLSLGFQEHGSEFRLDLG